MKEPKRLLSHGATDFERQLLRAVATERPSALLRSRMQRSLGLVGPLAWASNVKAMLGGVSGRISGSKIALSTAVAGVVVAGGIAAYQLVPRGGADVTPEVAATELADGVTPVDAPEPAAQPSPAGLPSSELASPATPEAASAPAIGVTAELAPGAARAQVNPGEVAAAPVPTDSPEDSRLREEIALLDAVKAALGRGERDQARESLAAYRQRFPSGVLRREANVLRRRAEAKSSHSGGGTVGPSD